MTINRYKAFAFHLCGSVFVALCVTALVFMVWYPGAMATATGVTSIFLIMLGVDVILGPCITLIIFNPAKKELKRDMAIVLLVQIMALMYGMHAVFIARPVYAVFNSDRFDLVFANDLDETKLAKVGNARFKSPPIWGPEVIAARRPETTKERNKILFSAIAGGDDLPQMPQYYVSYSEQRPQVLQRLQSIDTLRQLNQKGVKKVDALLLKYGNEIAYLPLRGKVQDLTVIVKRSTAEVLEINDLAPW